MRKQLLLMVCALAVAALLPTSTVDDPPRGLLVRLERAWDGDRVVLYDDGECLVYTWPNQKPIVIKFGRDKARKVYARMLAAKLGDSASCEEELPQNDWSVQVVDRIGGVRTGSVCTVDTLSPAAQTVGREFGLVWPVLRQLDYPDSHPVWPLEPSHFLTH